MGDIQRPIFIPSLYHPAEVKCHTNMARWDHDRVIGEHKNEHFITWSAYAGIALLLEDAPVGAQTSATPALRSGKRLPEILRDEE